MTKTTNGKVLVTSREELEQLIDAAIYHEGPYCNLNHLDISAVTDLSKLFQNSGFEGDISKWDVSNVKTMDRLFMGCAFNGDISNWDTSNVQDMSYMFMSSNFNEDISGWCVQSVVDMNGMFGRSPFNHDISQWNPVQLQSMRGMFAYSHFNGDLSRWNPSNLKDMTSAFWKSPFAGDISTWQLPCLEEYRRALNTFQPNLLGVLGVLDGTIEMPLDHPWSTILQSSKNLVSQLNGLTLEYGRIVLDQCLGITRSEAEHHMSQLNDLWLQEPD